MTTKLYIWFIISLCGGFLIARPLEDVANDVVDANVAINNAISAKGGDGTGGLKTAAERIINIPEPTVTFEHTYIAWSNDTKTITYQVDNATYKLVEWLQSDGGSYISLKVYANQATCLEVTVSELLADNQLEHTIAGDRTSTSARFGIHAYNSNMSFPYGSGWNDGYASATYQTLINGGTATIKLDGANAYVDNQLVFTAPAQTFQTAAPIGVFNQTNNQDSNARPMRGKILRVKVSKAVDSAGSVLPDMDLVPAIAVNQGNLPCLLDLNTAPNYQLYFAEGPTLNTPAAETNSVYSSDSQIQFTAVCPQPYETNIVGQAENTLILDDATRYIYNTQMNTNN